MSAVLALLACAAGLLGLGVVGVVGGRGRVGAAVVYLGSATVCALAAVSAIGVLLGGEPVSEVVLPIGLPWLGAHFRIDALSALFVVLVDVGGAAAAVYGLGHGRHEGHPRRVLPFFPAFLAAMHLVLLADDAFTFLFCWELMSLVSWALVMAHHQQGDNTRAGYVYLLMAGFGTLALLLALALLAGSEGGYAFADMRAVEPAPHVAALVVVLVLVGAGSKAGLLPLHVWLPLAHPAAPSHVSALMSGVMTKVAVYGFVRIVLDLLATPPWWAGLAVLLLGAVTAVVGVLHALMERDIKRMLAYSTIENVGIVFVGVGLALAFDAHGMGAAAALALTAALLHAANHSWFKSLLFLGAGAVLVATGERDMDAQGGLIHRMPVTAFTFLVGCAAISALPPLNGFASEWLLFQAVLQSPQIEQWGLRILVPGVGGLLALAAALAAACFVRAFGVVFLGRPRTPAAMRAAEVDRASLAAMVALVVLCVLAGIVPGVLIDALAPVTSALLDARLPTQAALGWLTVVPIAEGRSSYNGLLVFVFIAVSAWLTVRVVHRLASDRLRRGPAWDCGFPDASPLTQYASGSFAQPIRRVFGTTVFAARETVEMPPPGDGRAARHRVTLLDPAWRWIYDPITAAVAGASLRLNAMQFLTIRRYLGMVFLALVGLLLVIAIWR
ncbi:MAG: hydrogenase 4 subunit B [Ectothiorhodospiraceae bacterium]|nr:hydrogenase 4 subunit B [Chromatiales bacterium]MCP5154655.1 hydrogenase 4 subunit B [Ectothiorhodospiraceae bacterium]